MSSCSNVFCKPGSITVTMMILVVVVLVSRCTNVFILSFLFTWRVTVALARFVVPQSALRSTSKAVPMHST